MPAGRVVLLSSCLTTVSTKSNLIMVLGGALPYSSDPIENDWFCGSRSDLGFRARFKLPGTFEQTS